MKLLRNKNVMRRPRETVEHESKMKRMEKIIFLGEKVTKFTPRMILTVSNPMRFRKVCIEFMTR